MAESYATGVTTPELLASVPQGPPGFHFVYVLYAKSRGPDETSQMIYVGLTDNPHRRLRQHSRKWWWPSVDLEQTEVLGFPTRAQAEEAERAAIREFQPPLNRAGRLLVVTSI